eukprot:6206983-Pleurochrysis_carterae.AAC.3
MQAGMSAPNVEYHGYLAYETACKCHVEIQRLRESLGVYHAPCDDACMDGEHALFINGLAPVKRASAHYYEQTIGLQFLAQFC